MDTPDAIPLIVIFRPGSVTDWNTGASGNRDAARLANLLTRAGFTFKIIRPATLDEAACMTRQAAHKFRVIAAAGGDGTINTVASVLAGSRCCLGILPLGSGNDIARGLCIPRKLPDAVRLLKAGRDLLLSDAMTEHVNTVGTAGKKSTVPASSTHRRPGFQLEALIRKMDVGKVVYMESDHAALPDNALHGADNSSPDGHSVSARSLRNTIFINTLGAGFDGQVAWNASRIRWLSGKLKYLGGVLQSLFSYQACDMTVTVNGETLSGRFLMATVANGPFEGGGIPIAPSASPDDGCFHLVLIKDTGRIARIPLLFRVLLFGAAEGPKIIMKKCSSVNIKCARPVMVHSDGEVISHTITEATATIEPSILRVIAGLKGNRP